MQHLEEGTIHAWLDGALPPLEAEQVAKHAVECATCAAAVAEARGIIAGSARIVSALDDVPGGVIPSGSRTTTTATGTPLWRRLRLTPGRAALAATILLAVSATLTMRSSNVPSDNRADTGRVLAATKPLEKTVGATAAPGAATLDSIKVSGASSRLVSAPAMRKPEVVVQLPKPQPITEQRQIADAVAPRDSTTRELAKSRAAVQESVSGATAVAAAPPAAAAAPAASPASVMKANSAGPFRALNAPGMPGTFEGCYRLSADSASGSTEIPPGLPASFALSRPTEARSLARRAEAADVRADSSKGAIITSWQQLSTTQAHVTFAAGAGSMQPVSLTLTAGSPVGVASSGDRMTKVRVMRSSCPP